MTANNDPSTIVRARRSIYVALAGSLALLSLALMKSVWFGFENGIDWTFYALTAPPLAVLLGTTAILSDRAIRPPEILAGSDGLVLRLGLTTRRWSWDQIESFGLVRNRDRCVALYWYPTPQGKLSAQWLRYPFQGEPEDLLKTLNADLEAARARGVPAPVAAVASEPSPDEAARVARRTRQMNRMAIVSVVVLIVSVITLNASRTILLTPIDPRFLLGMQIAGAAFGALMPICLLRRVNASKSSPVPVGANITLCAIVGIPCVGIFAAIGGWCAWQISDVAAFHGSAAPFEPEHFRIQSFSTVRGGHEAVIDPNRTGERTSFLISDEDYRHLRQVDRPYQPSTLCYPALVQREGGAVRMRSPSRPHRFGGILVSCPAGA